MIISILLSKYGEKDFFMPRGRLSKEEIRYWVLEYKKQLNDEPYQYSSDPKNLANKYLNKILDKINEYRM